MTAYMLAEKPEKRLTFTSKLLYPKLMAALAMVLFIVSPLFSADGFSLPRLAVYIVLIIIPSVFYCKLLFGGEQELRNTDAGKILMGQGWGMTALLICILTLIKEPEITFVPTILFAAVCLCDVVISFILKKE